MTIGNRSVENVVATPGPQDYQPTKDKAAAGGLLNQTERQIASASAPYDAPLLGQTSSLQNKGGAIYDRREQQTEPTPGPYAVKMPKATAGFHIGDRQRDLAKDITPAPNAYTSKSDALAAPVQTFAHNEDRPAEPTAGPGDYNTQRQRSITGGEIGDRI